MKKLIFVLGLGLIIGMFNINNTEAQARVNISINIDMQPAWGPSGYNYAEFYYIPELNIYYDVVNMVYHYPNRGNWISSMYLPVAYCHYDFYSLYKVVLTGTPYPWRYNRQHVNLYSKYRYVYNQMPIYYVKDNRYNKARSNYRVWVEPRYMPRNNGRPNSHAFSANKHNGRISTEMRSTHPDTRKVTVNSRSSNSNATASQRSSSNKSSVNNNSSRTNNRTTVNSSSNSKNSSVSSRSSENKSTRSADTRGSARSESSNRTNRR